VLVKANHLRFNLLETDSEMSTVTKKIHQPNGGNAFWKMKIVRRRGNNFLRWRAIMHAIDSVKFIPKLRKSEAAVGEPDTEPTDQLTISGVSPKYNSFFVSGVSPIISNIR
jgi:hypothetical protein